MTSIRGFLEQEIHEAMAIVEETKGTVAMQAMERNERRKRKRVVQGKRPRKQKTDGRGTGVLVPERAASYQAAVRLLICRRLLKQVDLLEQGAFDQALDLALKPKIKIGSARQNAKINEYCSSYVMQLRAKFSRSNIVPLSAESQAWNEVEIHSMLDLRVQALQQGLAVLEFQQLSDPIAATIYVREYARWMVAKRFHTSNHLPNAKRLKQVYPIIKAEIPLDFMGIYGEAGKRAWAEAVDDFVTEMIAHH